MSVRDDWDWCYRLFFSVDVVGSTAFKSEQISDRDGDRDYGIPRWANTFEKLFEEFPQELIQQYERRVGGTFPNIDLPKIWKFVGDEILFSVRLDSHVDTLFHVIALKEAISAYSRTLTEKFPRLGLKATVWGAGFPVGNAVVNLRRDSEGSYAVTDYLGPGVDLGFRISAFADERRIPISVEVAEMLLATRVGKKRTDDLKIYFDGWQRLKGINRGQPYPILWVDRLNGKETAEDQLLGRDRECKVDALSTLVTSFIDRSLPHVRHPFIEGDVDEQFGKVPEDMLRIRGRMRKEDPDIAYRETINDSKAVESQAGLPNAKAPTIDKSKLAPAKPRKKKAQAKHKSKPKDKQKRKRKP